MIPSNNPRGLAWVAAAIVATLLVQPLPVRAETGITSDAIVFGQSACFTGPNRNLGLYYRAGILAAFEERNRAGGINGRVLRLLSLDDGYEPEQAAANAERFAVENDVFAVIGGVGTPTAKRIAPVLRTARIPFVGPFTGADFLRNFSRFPNVINLRAGYLDEVVTMVDYIVDDLGKKRFGVIYQDDTFGRSVLRNCQAALDAHDLPILAKTAHSRNTHAVHAGLFMIAKADLDAILIVGSYAANSEIINLSHSLGHDYIVANLSFVLSQELKKLLENRSEKILVTEVIPDPNSNASRVARRFRNALRPEYGQVETVATLVNEVAFEGYILGRFVIDVVERMGGVLTREQFMSTALSPEKVMIDDWSLEFAPGTNSGSKYIRLTNLGE
ncbi:MAG: ABC transporter substrate-binding protein [Gemmatimonadetes bacterium]|nr:ABC transporter substrate-binding protein [Gemmatimonadota bacterium]